MTGPAMLDLIRAAASTQPFGGYLEQQLTQVELNTDIQSTMKSLALKSSLVISLAVGLLIICGIILVRQKQGRLQPLQAKRYTHEHLAMSAWEPKAKLHADTYKLRNDETLASVAKLRYGHQNYAGVIKL